MLASDYLVESRADEALVSSALSLVIPKSGLKYQLRQNPVEEEATVEDGEICF